MAGRHGGKNATVFNLQVYKIDVQRNLVYLLGAVPGPQGGIVRMVDSKKATTNQQLSAMYDLPLPTWLVRSH
jgi:ribosomal protein L3